MKKTMGETPMMIDANCQIVLVCNLVGSFMELIGPE